MLIALALAASAQEPTEPVRTVEVVYQETLTFPDTFDGGRPFWQTNRYGQVLLVDRDEEVFAVDQAGRLLRSIEHPDAVENYRFPMKYLERWSKDWRVVRDGAAVPLADGPDFTGAALVERWGEDRRDALLRLVRDGVEVYAVSPPSDVRDFPTCIASVPESCLVSGVTLLREYAGDPLAKRVGEAQIDRACKDGVVRACFMGVALSDGRNAPAARTCLDGDAEACAVVAGGVFAEARLKGESSAAGERMLEYACEEGVAGACSEAAQLFDERDLPHNALLMLDRACVTGDRDACGEVEERRDRAFATGIAKGCLKDEPDAVACITLAQFLEERPLEGLGIDAFGSWSRACSAGEDSACRAMGPYVDRFGMEDERVGRAAEALASACAAGTLQACVGTAHLYVRLDIRDPRYPEARTLYADACSAGSIDGCLAGAEQSWAGPARRLEVADAATLYRTACEADDPRGCAGLGGLLATDNRRTTEAVDVLQKGCELGSASSCTRLGVLVQEGRHTADLDPATVFQKGCDEGEPMACHHLGETLSDGRVASVGDPAATAYATACEGGQMAACEALGRSHLARGTHYEAGVAAKHFERACEGGRMGACSELSALYKAGRGVDRDRKRGRELLVRAGELEPVKHVRLGARIGFLNLLGGDAEVVVPLPAGPAVSVGADFSYLPGTEGLSMSYVGPTVRVYPSHSARGLYAAAGWHQFRIVANEEVTTNAGFNGRVGVRVQKGMTFGGVEIGLASVDAPRVQEIIRPIPLVVPVFGLSGGVAFF